MVPFSSDPSQSVRTEPPHSKVPRGTPRRTLDLVLAQIGPGGQDAAVTDSERDAVERGRSIFQRLREAEQESPTPPEPGELAPGARSDAEDVDAAAPEPPASAGEAPTPVTDEEASITSSAPDDSAPSAAHPPGADSLEEASSSDAGSVRPTSPPGPAPGPLPGAAELDEFGSLLERSSGAPSPAPPPLAEPEPEAPTAPMPAAAVEAFESTVEQGTAGAGADRDDVAAPEPAAASTTTSFARPLPRVMAVANQKGGVGKTTTAVNLGACLADIGYRVLVVDLDPQGNASTGLGINIRDLQGSMYDVILHDLPIEDCVEATSVRNLFCAPSSLDLAGAEIELVPAFSRELRLKRALGEVHDDYDFVLIDCPPSLGLLTVNGLAAATEVVVPIQCEYYALEGLGQLLRNVNLVQRNLNPVLEVSAIILVMYDARTKLADQVVTEVRAHFGDKVCRNVVPRTVRLSEAPSFGQPIIAFDSSSRGAIAYRELAKEVSGGTPQRAR